MLIFVIYVQPPVDVGDGVAIVLAAFVPAVSYDPPGRDYSDD